MKRICKNLLLALVMVFTCLSAQAQRNGNQRLRRERLAEAQARYIAREIAMDDETTAKFVDTFCRFQREVWALGPRQRRNKDGRTEAQTGQSLQDRFEQSQKILDLRKKYYLEYSKFLTQKQIERVYQLEKQMMKRLSNRPQKRKSASRGR